MDIANFLKEKAYLPNTIIQYLDDDERKVDDINKFFDEFKAKKNKIYLKRLLQLLISIMNNHHRTNTFLDKIKNIINYYKKDIEQSFTKKELFDKFSKNKMALYIIFQNKMIEVDKSNIKNLSVRPIMDYFWPEIISFYPDHKKTIDTKYFEKREIGENDDYIANIIRNDLVEEFVSYVNTKNIPLNSKINKSQFETNSFLHDKDVTLIEYAAFFGSFQIFKYLQMNNVELTPSLWIHAIHSNNPEFIQILEDNHIEPEDKTFKTCIIESIKCYHNDIARYLIEKYQENNFFYPSICWEYDNYDIIPNDKDFYSNFHFNVKELYNLIQNNPIFINLLFKESYLNINLKEKEKTVLLMAMENNNIDMIKLLSSNSKIDLNMKYKKNGIEFTVLTMAIEKNNLKIIGILLSNKNINPNIKLSTKYNYEKTALSIAFEKKDINTIKFLLLENKFDLNIIFIIKGKEYTALTYSIENNLIEIVQILLKNAKMNPNIKFNIKGKEYTALTYSIENNLIEIAKLLLKNTNIDPNIKVKIDQQKEKTAFLMAIEKNNTVLAQLLLDNPKINPNVKHKVNYNSECTALSTAVEQSNYKITQFLLSKEKIDPDTFFKIDDKKCTALSMAFEKNNMKMAFILCSKSDPNIKFIIKNTENTALSMAIIKSDIPMIQLLLKRENINPNMKLIYKCINRNSIKKEIEEKTALSIAIENENYDIIKLLLTCPKIDPNVILNTKDFSTKQIIVSNTALHLAVMKGNKEIICLLLNDERTNVAPVN